MSMLYTEIASAAGLGLVSHSYYFVHGEHDLKAAKVSGLYILGGILLIFFKWTLQNTVLPQMLYETLITVGTYFVTLMGSIVFYRLFVSPVRHIPGPLSFRVTKLSHVVEMCRGDNCKTLHRLHKQYGDVVRTGPNEVTLFGTEAFYKVYGSDANCTKAPYYDLLHPMVSLDTTRDPVVHSHLRKVWDQSFSSKALGKIEPLVYSYAEELTRQFAKRLNRPLDVSEWFGYYTFDLMGSFGLNIEFGNLTRGTPHYIHTLYFLAHRKLGPLAAAPWIKHLAMGIPYIERMKHYRTFLEWTTDTLNRNIEQDDPERQDIIHHLINDAKNKGGIEANWQGVMGDFVLVMAAGSDPMRQVLTNLTYYLIRDPRHLAQVRDEIDSVDARDYRAVQLLSHLNACIYETMRLNPPVPSAGLRLTPSGGITVDNQYIPGNTTVLVPHYSLFRDERNFAQSEDWIPERFTTKPELIYDKQAFMPWSAGTFQCIGKRLSLIEIRVAAVMVLQTFDIEFAPGETGQKMFSEAEDFFTTTPGPLEIVFRKRKTT